jgi:quercetin dioxygenase-like cupin family protein
MIGKNCFVLLALAFGIFGAQEALAPAPVAVENEPLHHVVLKNDAVMVIHFTLPAGETTLYHTHVHDRVAIHLTGVSTTQQKMNEAEGAATLSKPGDISVLTADGPYTHRVHNVGSSAFEVLDVELLLRPQSASRSDGENLSLGKGQAVGENPSARVYKWVLAPGATSPMHTHVRPYLIVSATAFNLKMSAPAGQSMSESLKPGDFHWVDSKVTHSLSNEGTAEGQIVEVELK